METLNNNLSESVFLDSKNYIGVADIYCFAKTLQYVSELSAYEKSQVPHLYRWILQIQNMEGFNEVIKNLDSFQIEEIPFGLQPRKPAAPAKNKI